MPDHDGQERRDDRHVVRIELPLRTIGVVLLVLGALWLLRALWPVLLTMVGSLLLVGTLNPMVSSLEKRGLRRGLAIAAVYLALSLGLAAVVVLTIPALLAQVGSLMEHAPETQASAVNFLAAHRLTAPLAHNVQQFRLEAMVARGESHLFEITARMARVVGFGATAVVLSIYLIADREHAQGFLYSLLPRRYHVRTARVLLNLETIVGGYMRGQVITSALVGGFVLALLSALRVHNAMALAVFAGVTDVLPFVGGLLATTPAVLATLPRGPVAALGVMVALVAYQEFESRVIVPRIYGRALRLPPAAVVIALIAGGELLGILGALLALPFAAAIWMMVRELRVELPGEEVDDRRLRHRDEVAEEIYARGSRGASAEEAAGLAVRLAEAIRDRGGKSAEETAQEPMTGGEPGAHGGK